MKLNITAAQIEAEKERIRGLNSNTDLLDCLLTMPWSSEATEQELLSELKKFAYDRVIDRMGNTDDGR